MIGKAHQPLAGQSSRLTGLRVQSSVYGQVITLLFGTNRIAAKLIGYQDFTPHAQKSGSKKAGGGKKGQSDTSYTYSATIEALLCVGPIFGIGSVWDSRGQLATATTIQISTVPGGGGAISVTPPSSGNFHFDNGVSRDDPYSVGANDYGSDGLITLSGTQKTPLTKVGGSPAAGQYQITGSGAGRNYNFAAADAGKTVTINYTYAVPNSQGIGYPTATLAVTLFVGGRPQSPWSYLTSTHPGQDLSYAGVAYIAEANTDLGSAGALPNLNWEIRGLLSATLGGVIDAEPTGIVSFLLTDPFDGLGQGGANSGWDPAWIADVSNWFKYNVANGLFISPVYDAQQDLASMIQDICDQTNTQPVWSEGLLKFKTYGDTTVVGNGQTFTPNTQPVYDLTDDDYNSAGKEPVSISRSSTLDDVYNSVQVEFLNRANSYNPEVAESQDLNHVQLYGLKPLDPKRYHGVTTADVAKKICDFMVKRQVYVRSIYSFSLDRRGILLEPMDLVTLTDSNLGLIKTPVRITKISESPKGDLQFEAEEFPWGTAQPTLYAHQSNAGYQIDGLAEPGSINAPIILLSTNRMTGGAQPGYELIIGVSGASLNYGGCNVLFSEDNTDYELIGQIYGSATMGVLTASLANGSDPDTLHTLSVDLTQSRGVLTSVSTDQADTLQSACLLVDSASVFEVISFRTMNLTSAFHYTSDAYLRRGQLGTSAGSHLNSIPFLKFDEQVFIYEFDPKLLGKTVYFKFTAFNQAHSMIQPQSAATAYPFTIPTVAAPTGLTAFAEALGVRLSWNQVVGVVPILTYNVYRNTSNSFGGATKIASVSSNGTGAQGYFDKSASVNTLYFYWVTAVSAGSGIESGASSVASSAGIGPGTHSSYRPLTNPLTATDAGASATINIAGFTMRIGGLDVAYNSGSITSLSYGTIYYIYLLDTSFAGGSVTYLASTTKETILNSYGQLFVGSIRTPKAANADTIGNDDGGAGAQVGNLFRINPSQYLLASVSGTRVITDPQKAVNGDTSTYAEFTLSDPGGTGGFLNIVYGLPPAITAAWKSLTLFVKSSVPTNTTTNGSQIHVSYHLDMYALNPNPLAPSYPPGPSDMIFNITNGATRAITTDQISLPLTQNIGHVAVAIIFSFNIDTGHSITCRIYEIWIEGVF
jgi:hypothetical protein